MPDSPESIVIVGAGQAGGQLAAGLRQSGHEGVIVLLGEEPQPPYQRPPLSKQHLAGKVGLDKVHLKPESFYAEQDIDLRTGCRVTAVDRDRRQIELDDGTTLGYDRLVLATGSRVRRLDLPGADLNGIHYLRTLDDMQALQVDLRSGARLVLVGGGYIGLEVAAVATGLGLEVTVLEQAEQLMARVVGPEMGDFYRREHEAAGVDVRTGVRVEAFEGEDRVRAVRDADGHRHPADVVLVGVGVVPETSLAEAAGLAVSDGIEVDAHCVTADPAILAIGDCAGFPGPEGSRRRLESVPNALATARTAAATLRGEDKPYREVPWFWSDQYDLKLQIAGRRDGHDRTVLRGDPARRQFMVLYLREGVLIAVESVGNPREFMTLRQTIARGQHVDPEKLADPDTPLG